MNEKNILHEIVLQNSQDIKKLESEIEKIRINLLNLIIKIDCLEEKRKNRASFETLNSREQEIYEHICNSLSVTEKYIFNLTIIRQENTRSAASIMRCKRGNIRKHMANIYKKLKLPEIENFATVCKRYELIRLCGHFPIIL